MCDYEAQLCVDVRDRNALITILGHTTCGGKLNKHWGGMQYPTSPSSPIYVCIYLIYSSYNIISYCMICITISSK